MDRNNKFGFTLVELLAVIVILAIILVIAVPKVMSIIEDAKKGTLESTAKMIASAAENRYLENKVLGKKDTIECEDVVKINNVDYEKCIVEFIDNTAKVSIKGSGKFAGLNVCNGDKTSSIASDISCDVSYGNGATYIEKLEAFNGSANGLIVDNTVDKNIRYAGSSPSNKVYFNCKDTDSAGVSYGGANYDYASSCEVWRIIGVFDVASEVGGQTEKRIKIVRDELSVRMSFDSSASAVNNGYGINQWGKSTYTDGNEYNGADLMRMLDGYYIGEDDACRYCNGENQGTCENDCSSSVTPLSTTSLFMIDDALWELGAQIWIENMPVETMYNSERGSQSGKICEATNTHEGLYLCTDTVNRTTDWVGKIGLIYPSDYGYASTDSGCVGDIVNENSTCENNNWLHPSAWYWTLSPYEHAAIATRAWIVDPPLSGSNTIAYKAGGVRPSLYLSSNVQIIGGDGNTDPFKLSM